MKKLLMATVLALSLTGCASVQLDEIASAGAGIGGCAAGSLVGNFGGCLAVGGAAAGATILVTEESGGGTIDLSEIPEDQRAEVLKNQQLWEAIEHIGLYTVGGVIAAVVLLVWLQGLFARRPQDVIMKRKTGRR